MWTEKEVVQGRFCPAHTKSMSLCSLRRSLSDTCEEHRVLAPNPIFLNSLTRYPFFHFLALHWTIAKKLWMDTEQCTYRHGYPQHSEAVLKRANPSPHDYKNVLYRAAYQPPLRIKTATIGETTNHLLLIPYLLPEWIKKTKPAKVLCCPLPHPSSLSAQALLTEKTEIYCNWLISAYCSET